MTKDLTKDLTRKFLKRGQSEGSTTSTAKAAEDEAEKIAPPLNDEPQIVGDIPIKKSRLFVLFSPFTLTFLSLIMIRHSSAKLTRTAILLRRPSEPVHDVPAAVEENITGVVEDAVVEEVVDVKLKEEEVEEQEAGHEEEAPVKKQIHL